MHFSVPAWLACSLSTTRKEGLSSISSFPFGHLGYFLQHTFAGQELRCQVRETIEWFVVGSWCRWWLGVSAPRSTPWLQQDTRRLSAYMYSQSVSGCTEYTAVILILFYTLMEFFFIAEHFGGRLLVEVIGLKQLFEFTIKSEIRKTATMASATASILKHDPSTCTVKTYKKNAVPGMLIIIWQYNLQNVNSQGKPLLKRQNTS